MRKQNAISVGKLIKMLEKIPKSALVYINTADSPKVIGAKHFQTGDRRSFAMIEIKSQGMIVDAVG